MTPVIDAHQHYWNPARGDYGWMPKDDPVLSRPYLPADLTAPLAGTGVEKTVLIQAAASVEESQYMLGIADVTPSVAGVVGWIDFEDRDHLRHLERLRAHPKFVGVRPMIQDIPDDGWMLREDVRWAYAALVDLDLAFDALGFPRHLENFCRLFDLFPRLRAVVDHCMKPQIGAGEGAGEAYDFWARGMSRLARETDCCCKLSGLVTEATAGWTSADLAPYSAHVLESFGPYRVMWGSDWPVCLLRASYGQWRGVATELCSGLSESERDAVFGGTAARFYRLRI